MSSQQKLFQALADVFNVDVATINESSSPDTVAGWDSLAVVNLVAELEKVFDVEFDILEIADFRTVAIIKTVLQEKGIAF